MSENKTNSEIVLEFVNDIQSKAAALSYCKIPTITGGNVPAISDANAAASQLQQLLQRAGSIIEQDAEKILQMYEATNGDDYIEDMDKVGDEREKSATAEERIRTR